MGDEGDETKILLSQALLGQQKPEEALAELGRRVSSEATVAALLVEFDSRLLLKEFSDAQRVVERLAASAAPPEAVLLRRARLAWNQSNTQEALRWADAAIQEAPESIDAYGVRSEILAAQNRHVESAQSYSTVAQLAVERRLTQLRDRALFGVALQYLRAGQLELAAPAIADYTKAVGADEAGAKYLSASLAYERRQYAEAVSLLSEAALLVPDDAQVLRLLGAAQLAAGSARDARLSLRSALAADSDDASTIQLLVQAYLREGRSSEALELATELDAAVPYNMVLLAESLLVSGNPSDAIALLSESRQSGSLSAQGRFVLVRAYAAIDDVAAIEEMLQSDSRINASALLATIGLIEDFVANSGSADAPAMASRAVSDHPDDIDVHIASVMFLQTVGKLPESVERAQQSVSRFESSYPLQMLLGQAAVAAGQPSVAEAAFGVAKQLLPEESEPYLALAYLYDGRGQRQEMVAELEVAASIGADSMPRLVLARHYLSVGDLERADRYAREATALAPAYAAAYEIISSLAIRRNDYDGATRALRDAIELPDASGRLFAKLAQLYAEKGDSARGREVIQAGLKRFPGSTLIRLELARIDLNDGDLDSASNISDEVLAVDSSQPLAYLVAGEVAIRRGNLTRARRSFETAARLGVGLPATVGLFRTAELRQPGSGVGLLEAALQDGEESPAIRVLLAQAYSQNGQNDSAIVMYKAVLEREPDNVVVLNNLAWMLHQDGVSEALSYAERAAELAPKAAPILDTYGTILIGASRAAEAVSVLKQATILAPENTEFGYHYAQALAASGDTSGALAVARGVLDANPDGPLVRSAQALVEQLQRDANQ